MNPELLQALTAAKGLPMPIEEGVSIDRLAELFRKEKRLQALLRRTQGDEVDVPVMARYFAQTATGKNTVTRKAAQWTHAECAQACHGLEDKYFQAIRYTYALDDSVFHSLSLRLFEWALERAEREKWPERIVTLAGVEAKYKRDLVDMWMLEVRAPWRFRRAPNEADLRRIIMNLSEPVWRRRVSPLYESIREEFDKWLAIAICHMAHRLREDSEAA